MSKPKRLTFTEDFKKDAIPLIATSGRILPQIAEDVGVVLSRLWRSKQ